MISMTGYAYCEKTERDLTVSVEIRGYNSRYLEIFINLPPWLSVLETRIREQIASRCGRGKVEISIRIREQNAPVNISVNANAAKAYYDAINKLAEELNLEEKCGLSTLLRMENVLEIERTATRNVTGRKLNPYYRRQFKHLQKSASGKGSTQRKIFLPIWK